MPKMPPKSEGSKTNPRPVRGGGSKAGDLAKFGAAVNRGKAANSSKAKQIVGKMASEGTRPRSAGSPLAAAQRQIISSYAKSVTSAGRDASTKKEMGKAGMAKLGGYLKASDVSGKGRSAAAGRRVDAIKKLGAGNRKAANTGPKKRLPKTM
jgi:hypothetical protein